MIFFSGGKPPSSGSMERTAILGDGEGWTVYGLRTAIVRRGRATTVCRSGEFFMTPAYTRRIQVS
jgi:hypothetical protein